MSETELYGKVCRLMILKWLRRAHSLIVLSGSNQKKRFRIRLIYHNRNDCSAACRGAVHYYFDGLNDRFLSLLFLLSLLDLRSGICIV